MNVFRVAVVSWVEDTQGERLTDLFRDGLRELGLLLAQDRPNEVRHDAVRP
jgi:hypothetical protein